MLKAGGSSAQSTTVGPPILDNNEQPHQAISAKICIMNSVTSCEVLCGKKTCSTSCLLFCFFFSFNGSIFSVSGENLLMPYWPSGVAEPLLESITV